jgi:hypothetical protein
MNFISRKKTFGGQTEEKKNFRPISTKSEPVSKNSLLFDLLKMEIMRRNCSSGFFASNIFFLQFVLAVGGKQPGTQVNTIFEVHKFE